MRDEVVEKEHLIEFAMAMFHCIAIKLHGWKLTGTYGRTCAKYRTPSGTRLDVTFYLHAPDGLFSIFPRKANPNWEEPHIQLIVDQDERVVLSEKYDLPIISDRYWDFVTTLFAKLDSHTQ